MWLKSEGFVRLDALVSGCIQVVGSCVCIYFITGSVPVFLIIGLLFLELGQLEINIRNLWVPFWTVACLFLLSIEVLALSFHMLLQFLRDALVGISYSACW